MSLTILAIDPLEFIRSFALYFLHENSVHYNSVYFECLMKKKLKNITLSAPEEAIKNARLRARAQGVSLNSLFRSWLERLAGSNKVDYDELMSKLGHVSSGKTFTRDELNER